MLLNRKAYENRLEKLELLIKSVKDDINYFDSSKAEDSFYYSSFEAYKSQVTQNTFDASTYKSYGYSDEQIENEIKKNQAKIEEIYHSTIKTVESSINEVSLQIASIDSQLSAIESGQTEYSIKASNSGILHMMADYKEGMVVQAGNAVANITPENSDIVIETYKSIDKDIANVSGNGTIDAKACGTTTVVVSNGYAQTVVTVVVNENSVLDEVAYEEVAASDSDIEYPDTINADEYAIITSNMLKFYYDREKNITIYGNGYNIYLSGSDIVNYENELKPQIHFNEVEKGISFEIRDKLCGKITLDLSNMVTDERYLYLYDDNKEKYQEISIKDINTITIDTEGKYLISVEKLSNGVVNKYFVIIGLIAVALGIGIYVIVKRRYWFW